MKFQTTPRGLKCLQTSLRRAFSRDIWIDGRQFDSIAKSSDYPSVPAVFTFWNEVITQRGVSPLVVMVWFMECIRFPEKGKLTLDEQLDKAKELYEKSYSPDALEMSKKVFKKVHPELKKRLGIEDVGRYLWYNLDANGKNKFSILFNLMNVGSISPAFYMMFLNKFDVEQSVEYSEHCKEEESFRKLIRLSKFISF